MNTSYKGIMRIQKSVASGLSMCLTLFCFCNVKVYAVEQSDTVQQFVEMPHYISEEDAVSDIGENHINEDDIIDLKDDEDNYITVEYDEYYAPFITNADGIGIPTYEISEGEWVDADGKREFSYNGVVLSDIILHGEKDEYYYIHPDGNLLDCFLVDDGQPYIGFFDSEGRILNEAPGITDLRNLADCDNENRGEVYTAILNSITREYYESNDMPYETFLDYSEGGITGYDYEEDEIQYTYSFDGPDGFKIAVSGNKYDCDYSATLTHFYSLEQREYLFYVLHSVISEETLNTVFDVIDRDGLESAQDYHITGYDDSEITVHVGEFSQDSYRVKISGHIDHLYYHGAPTFEIEPSDYLPDSDGYVTLGDFSELSAMQTVYKITDSMVQERIDNDLSMYSEEVKTDKVADGNFVDMDLVASIEGEDNSTKSYETGIRVGNQIYGASFDEELIGAELGDELSFSVDFRNDGTSLIEEDWEGKVVDFRITINDISEDVIPEYDDDYISQCTDYSSKEEYETAVRADLEEEYKDYALEDTKDTLLQSAMEISEFDGYPEELYTFCEKETISNYGSFSDEYDLAAILEEIGFTQESFEEEVINDVNTHLFIAEMCRKNDIEVTAQDYADELRKAAALDEENEVKYEMMMGRECIVQELYEQKVKDFLYDMADITMVEEELNSN